ncbi:MAG: class I SAM-dependent methyltransferase [Actinomycetes bacterium]
MAGRAAAGLAGPHGRARALRPDGLIDQARFFGDLTDEVLRRVGVGPTGTVLGVDRSAEAVAVAERRARDAGLGDVAFAVQEVAELTVTAQVDALVGRLVLMYLDDPAAVLRRLLEAVRPGGAVAFQEMDMGAVACEPDCPLVTASGDRIRQTFARAGLDDRTGLKLARIYRDAGLPAPETLQGARVASGPDSPVYAYVARPPVPCCPSWSAPAWPPPPRSTPRPPGCGSRSWPPTPPSSRRPSSAPGPGSQPRLRPLEWGVIAVDQALHLSVLAMLAVA